MTESARRPIIWVIVAKGEPNPLGGLGGCEAELAEKCPEEFRRDNPWTEFAKYLFFGAKNGPGEWKWRIPEESIQRGTFHILWCLLGSCSMSLRDKMAVAGWMLSDMLTEIPKV